MSVNEETKDVRSMRCPVSHGKPGEDRAAARGAGAAGGQAATVRVLGCPLPKWARRLGAVACLFFLVKGLLWLLFPAGLVAWRWWGAE